MSISAFAFLAAFGGCLSFAPPPPGSRCSTTSTAIEWLTPAPAAGPPLRPSRFTYENSIADPALTSGIAVSGLQKFHLRAPGSHLLEIFLVSPEADRDPFRLVSNHRTLDERPVIARRPARMRPKTDNRFTSLLAIITGPANFSIETQASSYTIAMLRWTPIEQFERELVPQWLERARYLRTHYLTTAQGSTARRGWLQQLAERLHFSRDAAVRDEALLDRTRAWFWLAAENHEPDDIEQTHRLFVEGLRRMPANPMLRQMITASCSRMTTASRTMPSGAYCKTVQPVPWHVDLPPAPANAPEWAVTQRELIRRLEAITLWWVDKRQAPNGELGGRWGDDVEILRHWGPQALGFGSKPAAQGILRLSAGLWSSGTLEYGYDRGIRDVEHSSEPTTDTQPLAAALEPENREIIARLQQTAACIEHWLKSQPDGFVRFRSSWFNCREADTSPGRAVDVHLNTRAVGPALWYAFLTRDTAVVRQIAQWADAWIHAMRQTLHGKPAGLFPSVLRSADGAYRIGSGTWDKPQAEWDYFQWNGGSQASITFLVLAAYELTQDPKYLDAARESFEPAVDCRKHSDICAQMRQHPEAFLTWRKLTGLEKYDQAFGYKPALPDEAILTGMTAQARDSIAKLSLNFDMRTTEVIYTDRVNYPLPVDYRQRLFGGEAPRGDRYPTFAITWPAANVEFARAVLHASDNSLRLRAYSFELETKDAQLRLWRLKPGTYSWESGAAHGDFTVGPLPHTIRVPLPPQRDVTITVRPSAQARQ